MLVVTARLNWFFRAHCTANPEEALKMVQEKENVIDSETGFLRGVLLLTIGQKAKAPLYWEASRRERTREQGGGAARGIENRGVGGKTGRRRSRRRRRERRREKRKEKNNAAVGKRRRRVFLVLMDTWKRQLAAQPLEMGHDLKDRYHNTEKATR